MSVETKCGVLNAERMKSWERGNGNFSRYYIHEAYSRLPLRSEATTSCFDKQSSGVPWIWLRTDGNVFGAEHVQHSRHDKLASSSLGYVGGARCDAGRRASRSRPGTWCMTTTTSTSC